LEKFQSILEKTGRKPWIYYYFFLKKKKSKRRMEIHILGKTKRKPLIKKTRQGENP
jgi:hypothetical protein